MQAMTANRGQGTAPRSFRPGAPMLGSGSASRGTSERPAHRVDGGDVDPHLLALLHRLVAHKVIPSFAYGGIAYHPQLAVVGDNGPEAMVPLQGQGQGGSPWDHQLGSMEGLSRSGWGGGSVGRAMTGLNTKLNTMNGGSRAQIGDILGGGTGGNPAFGPNYLRDATRRAALQRWGAQQHQTGTASDLFGLDPMARRGAMVGAETAANSDLSGYLNSAELQGQQGYQELLQRLLMGERGYQQNDIEAMRAAEEAKKARGSFGGRLLGTAAGIGSSFIPGLSGGGGARNYGKSGWGQ